MSTFKRILLFFILPFLAAILYPPQLLAGGYALVIVAAALFAGLAFFLYRGRASALTLSIFVQGLNVIVRILMLFPNFATPGGLNLFYGLTTAVAIAISTYLLLRLDKSDVRVTMYR